MSRKIWSLIALVALVALGLVAWKAFRAEEFTHRLVIEWIEASTGLHASIDEMESNLRERYLRIHGLTLTNPEHFVEREAFVIESVYAEATWRTLLGRDQHFPKLHLRIDRIQVVRHPDGTTNLDGLNQGEPLFGAAPSLRASPYAGLAVIGVQAAPGELPPPPDLKIDELRIYVGAVRFVDYTMGSRGKPMTIDLAVNEERTYTDVTDLEQVLGEMVASLALEALPRNLGTLIPVAMEQLEEAAPEIMQGIRELLGGSRRSRREE